MAAVDGIKNKIDPGDPLDKNIYELTGEEAAKVPATPARLKESLDVLLEDHEFLTQGGVFSQELIESWVSYKMENEIQELYLRPHPHEFSLYYDS
jgi:glutamine synthetase